jgi:voltage-gated potassium channel
MNRVLWRVATIAAAIVLTLGIGTAGFVFIAGYPVFDGFYMALITMTTVGYMEVHPLSVAGRVFNSCYLFLSVCTLLLTMGVMTQGIIEAQLGNLLERRRMRKMIDKLRGHFIVCGFGRVGRGAAQELRAAGASLLIIDKQEARVEWAMRNGYLAVLGDSTRDETLKEAGVEHAKGLVAALATDADNLFAVISAKTLNANIHIAARAAEEEAERKMRQVGAESVFAPYTMTGTRLAQSLLKPHVRQFLDFTTSHLGPSVSIEQIEVLAGCELVGRTLKESKIGRELKVIVLGILRASGDMIFNPSAETVVEASDFLIVMGEEDPLRRLEARVGGAHV